MCPFRESLTEIVHQTKKKIIFVEEKSFIVVRRFEKQYHFRERYILVVRIWPIRTFFSLWPVYHVIDIVMKCQNHSRY